MAREILEITLTVHHFIQRRLQKGDSKEGGHCQASEPQGKRFHGCMLLVSGAHARFDITRKALHDALHLGYISGHDIEYHVADAAIGIAADIVLDRHRAARKRLARGTTVIGEGQGSPERNRDVLRIAAGLAGLVAQACDGLAHLIRGEAGWGTQTYGMPAISQTRRPADSRRSVPTDPDRRVRLAHWFGRKADVCKAHVFTSETWLLAGPQGPESFNILVAHFATLVEGVEAKRDKLLIQPTPTPRITRPPASASSVETTFAVRRAFRYGRMSTLVPSRTRVVHAARNARVVNGS